MQTTPALRVVDDLPPDVRPTENPWSSPAWGPVKKLLFRFAFVYLVLYNFPFPLFYIPYVGTVAAWYLRIWHASVSWVGEHVFGVTTTVQANGSGDSVYGYIQVFCFLVTSIAAALAWTLLDRTRRNYRGSTSASCSRSP
jgi:hypothetical protein